MTVPGVGGKPLKFTPEELETKIVEYFKYVDEENVQRKLRRFEGEKLKPYTVTGLCVYLDIHKETLIEYGKRPEYTEAVKRAKQRVENYVEEGLLNGSINPIGGIFNLKNNFGWVDRLDINATSQPEQLTPSDIRQQLQDRKKLENGIKLIEGKE